MMDWSVKVMVEVKGPKEGPVTATVEYANTTKEMAVGIQNRLAALVVELNKK